MWDAGIALLRYLAAHVDVVAGRCVVEVGAGTGIVGLAAARLGAGVTVITDMEHVCPLIRQNVALSGVEDRYLATAVLRLCAVLSVALIVVRVVARAGVRSCRCCGAATRCQRR